ncbi:Flp pilus assembly protein CpaB [Blastococcus sp. TF02-8]|uniref:Flp pilus assembly protein CpaB n=1 Tax=Blastococcus sp. TF02-8 TaxID=2250574 RepID=UPI000DEB5439|nr:Flp pilus assembly protein CpaB [Blastococcus sp. TF02-8]RBY95091.1 Flp pilus assembly protein CpaB [Blastococcus sp. TF02-8]
MFRLRRPRSPALLARRIAAGALVALALALALRPAPAPAEAAAGRRVVVAAVDLPAGARLTAEHLTVATLPEAAAPAGTVERPALLERQVLASPVRRGEPLTDARLVGTGLTSRLPAGQVAAPVRLADLGVSALVRPGDRVDVLATDDAGTAERVAVAALVLAVPGQGTDDDPGAGLLLLAVDEGTATALAAASTTATLTISLPPP